MSYIKNCWLTFNVSNGCVTIPDNTPDIIEAYNEFFVLFSIDNCFSIYGVNVKNPAVYIDSLRQVLRNPL